MSNFWGAVHNSSVFCHDRKIFYTIFCVYIDEETNKGGNNMKIKPTNDLLFKK